MLFREKASSQKVKAIVQKLSGVNSSHFALAEGVGD